MKIAGVMVFVFALFSGKSPENCPK